jgi:hypothetical protein
MPIPGAGEGAEGLHGRSVGGSSLGPEAQDGTGPNVRTGAGRDGPVRARTAVHRGVLVASLSCDLAHIWSFLSRSDGSIPFLVNPHFVPRPLGEKLGMRVAGLVHGRASRHGVSAGPAPRRAQRARRVAVPCRR